MNTQQVVVAFLYGANKNTIVEKEYFLREIYKVHFFGEDFG